MYSEFSLSWGDNSKGKEPEHERVRILELKEDKRSVCGRRGFSKSNILELSLFCCVVCVCVLFETRSHSVALAGLDGTHYVDQGVL